VRNELISAFGSGSGSGRYLLKLSVRERGMGVSALRGTHVRRFRSQWTVKYALVEATGGKLLTSGESTSAVPFDLIDEPVSDMQAQENAKVRGAREVAQDIRLRLSAYFASVGG
jgi:LPS-assembly lipoprotein